MVLGGDFDFAGLNDGVTPVVVDAVKFGVGLARHQACSSGLPFIDNKAPVISLDADSPVHPSYLQAIFTYLRENPDFTAGHVNFQHRHCGNDAEKQAIGVYELHLKQHRQRLEQSLHLTRNVSLVLLFLRGDQGDLVQNLSFKLRFHQ